MYFCRLKYLLGFCLHQMMPNELKCVINIIMKKILCFLLFAFCLTTALQAQTQTLTIGSPEEYYSAYFPIYGLWLDEEGTLSQTIIPSDLLTDMNGGTISKMTFYTLASYYLSLDDSYSPPQNQWLSETGTVFSVALSEVEESIFPESSEPAGYDHNSLTEVYHGTFPESISQLEIELDNPYQYHGGNLLVSIIVVEGGDYQFCQWVGVDDGETNLSYCQYNNYWGAYTFMPKTTFTYVPATTEPCVISEVYINDYESPVAGENSQDHRNITVPEDANYSLNSLTIPTWWDENADDNFYGIFVEGTRYSIGVILEANSGCVFDDNCTFYVNGNATLVDPEYTYVAEGGASAEVWTMPEAATAATEPIEPGECGPAVDCEGTSYPTVKIGDLCWMQKNLAAKSCVTSGNVYAYVNDQFPDEDANVATYGLLYDEDAAMQGIGSGAKAEAANTGICPDGYRLPTVAEIEALGAAYTADELKSTNYWIPGGGGTDAAGLGWLPGGCYNDNAGRFESMLLEGYLWATEEVNGETQPAMYKITYYCSTILMRVEDFEGLSASVRCVKEAGEEPEFTCGDNLIIGENSYPTVQIGTQCWTKTNMRETKDKNGNDFINGISAAAGSFDNFEDAVIYIPTEETWIVYNSSVTYDENTFGYYYNWEAAKKVCPEGWHLPSDAEWTSMEEYVSNYQEGGEYKYRCDQTEPTHIAQALASNMGWNSSPNPCVVGNNPSTNNKTGFSAVPAGWCVYTLFVSAGTDALFWSSTQFDSDHAYFRYMSHNGRVMARMDNNKDDGYSVRCLRD